MIILPNARTLTKLEHAHNSPIRFNEISKYNDQVISGIYLITNLINFKKYIGRSSNLMRRYKEHNNFTSDSTATKYLYAEMHEYGKGNFSFEVLITHACDSKTELAYINSFDTCNYHKGYNGSNKPIIKTTTNSKPIQVIKGSPYVPIVSKPIIQVKQRLIDSMPHIAGTPFVK